MQDFRGPGLTTISDGEVHDMCQRVLLPGAAPLLLSPVCVSITQTPTLFPGFAPKGLQGIFRRILDCVRHTIDTMVPGKSFDVQ